MLQRDAAGLPLLPEPCADGSLPLLLIELKWNKILLVGITYDAKSKKAYLQDRGMQEIMPHLPPALDASLDGRPAIIISRRSLPCITDAGNKAEYLYIGERSENDRKATA